MKIWAHRGAGLEALKKYNIPANSLDAFNFSRQLDIDGIETDICFSLDNQPIIHHPGAMVPDPTKMTWERIKSLYPKIVHFSDFLNFLTKCNLICALDIKQNSRRLIERVACGIFDSKMIERIFITSTQMRLPFAGFETNSELLIYAKKIDPKIKTHVIDTIPLSLNRTVRLTNADMISFGWINDMALSRYLFDYFYKYILPFQCRKLSVRLLGGIVKSKEDVELLLKVSGGAITDIMSDDIENTLACLRG